MAIKNRLAVSFGVTGGMLVGLSTLGTSPGLAFTITNGSFESGLTGWTVIDQAGSSGSWYSQTGTTSPISNGSVAAPPAGGFAAMTDTSSPGSHVLYQDLVLEADTSHSLSFQVHINNRAGSFSTPDTMDYTTNPNQQFRVDLVPTSFNLFGASASGGILANIYQTKVGDPLVSGYTPVTFDLTPFAGQTVRLAFRQVDNQQVFNAGVDAVEVTTTPVPVPPALVGTLLGAGLGVGSRLKKKLAGANKA
jgi:hypothetical protein